MWLCGQPLHALRDFQTSSSRPASRLPTRASKICRYDAHILVFLFYGVPAMPVLISDPQVLLRFDSPPGEVAAGWVRLHRPRCLRFALGSKHRVRADAAGQLGLELVRYLFSIQTGKRPIGIHCLMGCARSRQGPDVESISFSCMIPE